MGHCFMQLSSRDMLALKAGVGKAVSPVLILSLSSGDNRLCRQALVYVELCLSSKPGLYGKLNGTFPSRLRLDALFSVCNLICSYLCSPMESLEFGTIYGLVSEEVFDT